MLRDKEFLQSLSRGALQIGVAMSLAIGARTAAHADQTWLYEWRDASGITTYSQVPPTKGTPGAAIREFGRLDYWPDRAMSSGCRRANAQTEKAMPRSFDLPGSGRIKPKAGHESLLDRAQQVGVWRGLRRLRSGGPVVVCSSRAAVPALAVVGQCRAGAAWTGGLVNCRVRTP
jgi:hypothetical protein